MNDLPVGRSVDETLRLVQVQLSPPSWNEYLSLKDQATGYNFSMAVNFLSTDTRCSQSQMGVFLYYADSPFQPTMRAIKEWTP